MSAIRLLVLGAVRLRGRAHGYQVRNDLESWGAHEWSNAKPGSIYHALKQMARQGLLHAHETAPSTAGGPPRTEYETTGEGTREYFALLRRAVSSHDAHTDVLSAGLGFVVDLPRREAVDLLRRRVEGLEEWRGGVVAHYAPEEGPGQAGHIGEIMDMWVHSAESDAAWTRSLIRRIEGGAYSFAGEGGDPYEGVLTGEEPEASPSG
ncbi:MULTISPECIES: PadR family transcriptional regulator [Nocardiopsis]|uniref:Transcriptional regulator, PadR-like family n=1 Tax=Nocardiopsis dassonvillei (strain ATCC 23218 / DSM 43111 / CIP 107115 / JCM 7437 / KCTC 9190 / NBRC 14626 / NCTC 10488 / NRRL B-5397 / IMRU 509) TaxID=446468 RepID=D7B2H1_NOCDD|nr:MULTISPECIES: PadR family transcriptional regulator [Nocardiopsis]ADH68628.1 transcriptional regulator, PadR-like family [Nocardiopsis dassonvillei subsp. dassonvillei DSM 43111]APC36697.1 transcriptional regulator [Nocardiopsis dassonvillei]NKY78530.1 PadR family transcriptional regulator [Nocardiopsis dassonvillei]VEI89137.1 transcriptional regulator, Acidobacterial, PadR-family [Nocardiopsis dassonvillei]